MKRLLYIILLGVVYTTSAMGQNAVDTDIMNADLDRLFRALVDRKPFIEEGEEGNSADYKGKVFDIAEEMPQFPGGSNALFTYLSQNVRYPKYAEDKDIQGRVICSFIVEKDGSINEVTVVKNVHETLDREAIRVIKSMPRWVPGKSKGVHIRVRYNLPINFKL